MKFGGIIYLSEANQQHLPMFEELRVSVAIRDTMLSVSTKNVPSKGIYFLNTPESARDIIGLVSGRCTYDISQIHTHLVDIVRNLPRRPSQKSTWRRIRGRAVSLFS